MRKILAVTTIAALVLGGCASVPSQLSGTDFASVTPKQAASGIAPGAHVRWGGQIIAVTPKADDTCFEVLSRALYPDARPRPRGSSDGRFIACGKGFYDPELYHKGRDLTVAGHIDGTEKHKVGGYEYTYPRIAADQIYLWPMRNRHDDAFYPPYYYDPFWGPYAPYWGTGWWYPPVIVVPSSGGHHHDHGK